MTLLDRLLFRAFLKAYVYCLSSLLCLYVVVDLFTNLEDFAPHAQGLGATLELVRTVRYAQAFSFKYSPRPGTPGAEMKDHVAEAVKDQRLQRLQALLAEQQREFTAAMAGKTIDLLIEKPGRQPGQRVGRSPWLQPVIVDETAGEIGDIIDVRITRTGQNSLFAEPV